MVKKIFPLLCVLFLLSACGAQSRIQDSPELHISRDFGYSSLGSGEIQGSFSISYSGPATVNRVVFTIDGNPMGDVNNNFPYVLKFNTSSYSLGKHTLGAVGFTQDGRELAAKDIQVKFVTAGEGWQAALKIVVPVLVLVLIFTLVGLGGPILLHRGKKLDLAPGTPRNYGIRGGVICPRCKRPSVLGILNMNIGFHRLVLCPFCGKWSFLRPRSLTELRAAENAEIDEVNVAKPPSGKTDEEKLSRDLDESRYQDL